MKTKALDVVQGWNNPFRELARMQSDFERFFQDLPIGGKLDQAPSCEIDENKDSYIVKFDMPGIAKDQVKIELDGNQLTVSGERKEETKTDGKKSHFSEIRYGSYMRSFTFPTPVNENKVDAKFENGVLKITLPKVEASKSKTVQIQ